MVPQRLVTAVESSGRPGARTLTGGRRGDGDAGARGGHLRAAAHRNGREASKLLTVPQAPPPETQPGFRDALNYGSAYASRAPSAAEISAKPVNKRLMPT
jgi:hypothetical protein